MASTPTSYTVLQHLLTLHLPPPPPPPPPPPLADPVRVTQFQLRQQQPVEQFAGVEFWVVVRQRPTTDVDETTRHERDGFEKQQKEIDSRIEKI
jgi:hypothetical protein